MERRIKIIGGGLAGSEAAWQIANLGCKVSIYEMRKGENYTFAHKTDKLAELVCSNSFRNDDPTSAIGLLHEELRIAGSLIMKVADKNRIPAGSALAVDREAFSEEVQQMLISHPNIEIIREEISDISDDEITIIATGPLTSDNLTKRIIEITGKDQLAFFDAIAPIIFRDSINFDICWMQSRYDKTSAGGNGMDYINCPMDSEQYFNFIEELNMGEKLDFKDWEKNTPYFNGCLPIEVMAERGPNTLRFGPMKPVGLTNPRSKIKPYAVVQLRQDNKIGTLYNMVGFQTKLKYGDQQRIFRKIPGLENAEFARLGGMHRNTFIKSPELLDKYLKLTNKNNIYFAGQITGVEGYVESCATGLMAGLYAAARVKGMDITEIPDVTAIGSLVKHITENANNQTFQPMNVNFGLFVPLDNKIKKQDRPSEYSKRAINAIKDWIRYWR